MDDNIGKKKKMWLKIKSFKNSFIYFVCKGGIVMINLYLSSFSLKWWLRGEDGEKYGFLLLFGLTQYCPLMDSFTY